MLLRTFHWTAEENFESIVESNLKVPAADPADGSADQILPCFLVDEVAIPAAVAKLRQAIALIREAWPNADANPQAAPTSTGSETIMEAEEAEADDATTSRWRRSSEKSHSGVRSKQTSDTQATGELPYGGDLQAAMRAQDRPAVKLLMALRDQNPNQVPQVSSSKGGRRWGTKKAEDIQQCAPSRPPVRAVLQKIGDLLRATEDYIIHQCNCVYAGRAQGIAESIFDAFPDADVYRNLARSKTKSLNIIGVARFQPNLSTTLMSDPFPAVPAIPIDPNAASAHRPLNLEQMQRFLIVEVGHLDHEVVEDALCRYQGVPPEAPKRGVKPDPSLERARLARARRLLYPSAAPALAKAGVHAEIVANHSVLVVQQELPKIRSPAWLRANGSLEAENRPGGDAPLWYSRFIALCMLIMYVLLIFFQLVTHTHLFEGEDKDEEDEPGILGFYGGIFWLAVITVFIATLSQWIVDTIEGAAASLGMPILFISGILVPIVGNAAEHAASVVFAYRNKMEIALGSAVGSAVQISVTRL
eukprot:s1739_g2.t1